MLYSFIGYSVFEHYLLCSQTTKAEGRSIKCRRQKAVTLLRSLKVKHTKEEAVKQAVPVLRRGMSKCCYNDTTQCNAKTRGNQFGSLAY